MEVDETGMSMQSGSIILPLQEVFLLQSATIAFQNNIVYYPVEFKKIYIKGNYSSKRWV